MSPKVHEKKDKLQIYHHARDNAIASVGKVIRYQTALIQSNPNYSTNLVSYWTNLLPITHDVAEAAVQYEFLSDFIIDQPAFILRNDQAATA